MGGQLDELLACPAARCLRVLSLLYCILFNAR